MATVALGRNDDRTKALRDDRRGTGQPGGVAHGIAGEMTGLDIHYDLGDGHPLLGRRMPDLDLVTDGGPRSSACCTGQGPC